MKRTRIRKKLRAQRDKREEEKSFHLLYEICPFSFTDKWVPVTTASRVLRLRMNERPPIWRVAENTLNKQSQRADKGWSYSWGVGQVANNSSP
jgi:hypothetical protein